jgi:excisionase family DNA binding protein
MGYTTAAVNEILTVAEAAQFLRKHPGTIRRWIASKKLKAKKVPAGGTGVFVILKTDLLEFSIEKMVRAERIVKKEVKVAKTPTSGQETLPI